MILGKGRIATEDWNGFFRTFSPKTKRKLARGSNSNERSPVKKSI